MLTVWTLALTSSESRKGQCDNGDIVIHMDLSYRSVDLYCTLTLAR
jgi:hypothetical protein